MSHKHVAQSCEVLLEYVLVDYTFVSIFIMPLGEYERQRVVALYRHLEAPSSSDLVECKGICTTR